MARPSRSKLPGYPQHVIQRGNDRKPCFFTDADHFLYLHAVRDAAARHGCAIHAYVLMTNHVHLLVTPSDDTGVSRLMQCVGRQYVAHVNRRYERTGTLWEGRFKASTVLDDGYLLACHRYIELNPVRAGMVSAPADYRWSSHSHYLGARDPGITPHPAYLALGQTNAARRAAYVNLIRQTLRDEELAAIRLRLQQQRPLGVAGPGSETSLTPL